MDTISDADTNLYKKQRSVLIVFIFAKLCSEVIYYSRL
jgi:hypothetical protein